MFAPELQQTGTENRTGFSIFDPGARTWFVMEEDKLVSSATPPAATQVIFDENRAWDTLENGRKRWPELEPCVVIAHEVEAPVFRETGIEIEVLRSKDVNFHVRGPAEQIDAWVARYLVDFPKAFYDTSASAHIETAGIKTVRVFRRRTAKASF